MQNHWYILHGNYGKEGIQLSRHQSRSHFTDHLPAQALHILINLEGTALLFGHSLRVSLSSGTMAIFHRVEGENITASRLTTEESDDFLILSVSTEWISRTFGSRQHALHPQLRGILKQQKGNSTEINRVRSLSLAEREIAHELTSPPVAKAAQVFWYPAKVLEILTLHIFAPANISEPEPFCSQHKRNEKTRAEKCVLWLKERLDKPLNLSSLAQHVGCAPHYLSRQFKKHSGMTLKQKHRELRIDHAARLLLDGDYNVTEAAMEVGYNSLSHFSKAFQEEKGQLPSEFTQNP